MKVSVGLKRVAPLQAVIIIQTNWISPRKSQRVGFVYSLLLVFLLSKTSKQILPVSKLLRVLFESQSQSILILILIQVSLPLIFCPESFKMTLREIIFKFLLTTLHPGLRWLRGDTESEWKFLENAALNTVCFWPRCPYSTHTEPQPVLSMDQWKKKKKGGRKERGIALLLSSIYHSGVQRPAVNLILRCDK